MISGPLFIISDHCSLNRIVLAKLGRSVIAQFARESSCLIQICSKILPRYVSLLSCGFQWIFLFKTEITRYILRVDISVIKPKIKSKWISLVIPTSTIRDIIPRWLASRNIYRIST